MTALSTVTTLGAGIHAISADAYHADSTTETPSLSASIAALLCSSSPAHARAAHARLNPDHQREERDIYDVGTIAHQILLEGSFDRLAVVDAKDWRTKAAQEERDAARNAGLTPILIDKLAEVEAMVAAAREQLDQHNAAPPLFTDGKPEQTLIWEEPGGVTCRARLDWLRDDHTQVLDLKTTSRSAHPRAYERALFSVGGDVQCAMYLRGLAAATGSKQWANFAWVVVETSAPFALSVIKPAADVLELGNRKVEYAIRKWRDCLETGSWPAYGNDVAYAHAPEWEIQRWLEREALAEAPNERKAA